MNATPYRDPDTGWTGMVEEQGGSRLIPGQSVVLPGNVFGTVVDFPTEDRVRVKLASLAITRFYTDEVQTRAEALYAAHRLLTRIANDLGDLGLMDAMEAADAYVERAAQQADAADAVKGLSAS